MLRWVRWCTKVIVVVPSTSVSVISYDTPYGPSLVIRLADFIERLRYVRGELHFDADYIRGRRVKTRVTVRANGTVALETIGRGKAALRWLERMQGKKLMHLVDQ